MTTKYPMAIAAAPGKIEYRDHVAPELGARDVKLKVRAVTLCGSDAHIFKGKHLAAPLPVPVGHEIAGEVVEVGPQVTRAQIGDRVTVEPVITCGKCYFCQRGKYHLCTEISFQYRRGQGGLTPYFVVAENWVHPVSKSIPYAEIALLEPLSVALHAVKKSGLSLGQSSAIFGAGAIGLLILQLACLSGGGKMLVIDINPGRLRVAEELGASNVLDNRAADVLEAIFAETGGLGADRAFEAVGLPVTLVQALKSVRKGGLVVLVGLFEQAETSIPANIFVQREILLTGSQGYNWDFQEAVELLVEGKVDLKRLITHQFPFSEVQRAFDTMIDPAKGAIKVVVNVDG